MSQQSQAHVHLKETSSGVSLAKSATTWNGENWRVTCTKGGHFVEGHSVEERVVSADTPRDVGYLFCVIRGLT